MRSTELSSGSYLRSYEWLLWATLLPFLLLLRPYDGLVQDARIYIGRGIADRDPPGLGRDLMFATDGQTGFTLLKPVIDGVLGFMAPTEVSIVLSLVGSLVWLGALIVLCRCLAGGRTAWAAAVCVLALSPDYGAFGTFVYGESVVTPRVFAEAAAMGAFAGLLQGRRLLPLLLFAVSAALHPLMALSGIAVAILILIHDDRRWLAPVLGLVVAVMAAAALKLPLAGRLFETIDPEWLAIIKARSINLFPSLWGGDVFARVAARAAATVIAASVAPPRVRVLLVATLVVALGGLALSWLFGDSIPVLLVTQLQPWRALWLLSLLGNASVALAVVGLWHRGPAARLTLATLALAWVSISTPPLAIGLAAAAIVMGTADLRGVRLGVSSRLAWTASAFALGLIVLDGVRAAAALGVYLQAAWRGDGEATYSYMLAATVQRWPLVLGSLTVALWPVSGTPSVARAKIRRAAASCGIATAFAIGILLWNSGGSDRRMIDAASGSAAELKRLIGSEPGSILWVDDYNESWFLADRPAYFNSTQGCPILFSRRLATAWQARGETLVSLGLAHQYNLTPWASQSDEDEALSVSRASIEAVCGVPDHPVAVVAPGSHLDAAPPGWPVGVWHPPVPVRHFSVDGTGLHWRKTDTFTVIRCPGTSAPPT